jgi:hypothetical protein
MITDHKTVMNKLFAKRIKLLVKSMRRRNNNIKKGVQQIHVVVNLICLPTDKKSNQALNRINDLQLHKT